MSKIESNKSKHVLGYAMVPPYHAPLHDKRGQGLVKNLAQLFPTPEAAEASRTQYTYDFQIVEVWTYV